MKLASSLVVFCLGAFVCHGEAMTLRGSGSIPPGDLGQLQKLLLMSGADGQDFNQLQRLLQAGDGAPGPSMDSFTKNLDELVKRLVKQVVAAHQADRRALDDERTRLFNGCRGPKSHLHDGVQTKKVVNFLQSYDASRAASGRCVREKMKLDKQLDSCQGLVNSLQESHDSLCQNVEAIKDPSTHMCTPMPTMNTRKDWLLNIQAYFAREIHALDQEQQGCSSMKAKLANATPPCDAKKAELDKHKSDCDALAQSAEDEKCTYIESVGSMCGEYDACYQAAVGSWENLTASTSEQVVSRKLQWRMLMRLECVVSAWTDTGVDEGKLKACAAKGRYSTSHLNMNYPLPPEKVSCKAEIRHGITDTCGSNLPTAAPPPREEVLKERAEETLQELPPLMQQKASDNFVQLSCGDYQEFPNFNVEGTDGGGESDLKVCSISGDIRNNEVKRNQCFAECCENKECIGLVFHPWGTMLKKQWSHASSRKGFMTYRLMKKPLLPGL